MCLLQEIETESNLLNSSHSNEVTNRKKNELWVAIATKVSAIGICNRQVSDVRDKWKNLKSEALKRQADKKKTGGGPSLKAGPYDDIVLNIIGQSAPIKEGIACGMLNFFTHKYYRLLLY